MNMYKNPFKNSVYRLCMGSLWTRIWPNRAFMTNPYRYGIGLCRKITLYTAYGSHTMVHVRTAEKSLHPLVQKQQEKILMFWEKRWKYFLKNCRFQEKHIFFNFAFTPASSYSPFIGKQFIILLFIPGRGQRYVKTSGSGTNTRAPTRRQIRWAELPDISD